MKLHPVCLFSSPVHDLQRRLHGRCSGTCASVAALLVSERRRAGLVAVHADYICLVGNTVLEHRRKCLTNPSQTVCKHVLDVHCAHYEFLELRALDATAGAVLEFRCICVGADKYSYASSAFRLCTPRPCARWRKSLAMSSSAGAESGPSPYFSRNWPQFSLSSGDR